MGAAASIFDWLPSMNKTMKRRKEKGTLMRRKANSKKTKLKKRKD